MNDLRDFSNSLRSRLPQVLGLSLLVIVLMGEMIFAITQLLPVVRAHTALSAQVAEARAALTPPTGEQALEAALQKRLNKLQEALDKAADPFLAEAEVPVVLNHLYRYADESGVQIVQIAASRAAQSKSQAAPTAHAVQSFKVEVTGPTLQLVAFVTRMQEAALPTVILDDLNIKKGRGDVGVSTLTMQIHFYTSPYATAVASP